MQEYLKFRNESTIDPVVITFYPWIEGKSKGQPVQLDGRTSLVERVEVVNPAITAEVQRIRIDGKEMELPNHGLVRTGDPRTARPSAQP